LNHALSASHQTNGSEDINSTSPAGNDCSLPRLPGTQFTAVGTHIRPNIPSISLRNLQDNARLDNLFDFIGSLFLRKVLVKGIIVHI
jgi:hypothetical protein